MVLPQTNKAVLDAGAPCHPRDAGVFLSIELCDKRAGHPLYRFVEDTKPGQRGARAHGYSAPAGTCSHRQEKESSPMTDRATTATEAVANDDAPAPATGKRGSASTRELARRRSGTDEVLSSSIPTSTAWSFPSA